MFGTLLISKFPKCSHNLDSKIYNLCESKLKVNRDKIKLKSSLYKTGGDTSTFKRFEKKAQHKSQMNRKALIKLIAYLF